MPPEGSPETGPWRGLPALVLAGLLLRLAFAFTAWNVYAPDEVFQYLEQAHRYVFGYGLIPWEFRFAARSWLVPLALAAPLQVSKLAGVDDPARYVLVVKSLLCLLSVSVIVSCYHVGRNLVSERAGRLAALLACFWYELVYLAPRPMPEVLSTYFLLAALACVTDPRRGRRPVLFGLSLGLAVAVRVQYLPVAALLALLAVGTWPRRALVRGAVALLGVGLLAGCLDKLTWGGWFVSYYANYQFNATRGAATLFGTSPANRYVLKLGVASAGLLPLVALVSLGFARRLWIPVATLLVIVGVHMVIPHKEYRFIVAAIPVLLVLMAGVTTLVAARVAGPRAILVPRAAAGALALVTVLGFMGRLPLERTLYPNQPLFADTNELSAFLFLHRQADLAGVLLRDVPWWHTGGYAYLHRDVPLYLPQHENAMRQDGQPGPRAYASHVVCPVSTAEIEGFTGVARFGQIEVRKQLAPPTAYALLPSYTRVVPQAGIDGVYPEPVRPRL